VDGAPSGTQPELAEGAHFSKKWVAFGILFVALAALIAVIAWLAVRRSPTAMTPSASSLRRLTANPAEAPILGGTISPDGKYLAYADKTGFYLRQIATGEVHAVPLPTGFNTRPASWFPDGTHLVAIWVAGPNDPPSLWNVSIIGGAPRKLTEDGTSPSVSPDGSQIAFLSASGTSQEIWMMQADGGNPRKLRASSGDLVGPPAWSPDGKRIVYGSGKYHGGAQNVDAAVESIDLATGQTQSVLSLPGLGSSIAWTADNNLLFAVAERPPSQDDSNLWKVSLDPGTGKAMGSPIRLTSDPGFVSGLTLTSDGKRLAFFKHAFQPDVYIAALESRGTRISNRTRLTLDERQDFPFSWTPDSRELLFDSDRDGTFHIFRQAIDRATPELLAGGNEQLVTPRLTPDRSTILYLVTPKFDQSTNEVRIMRMPLAGGPPQLVLKGNAINNHQCAVLPATLCLFSEIEQHEIRFFRFTPADGTSVEIPQLRRRDDDYYNFNWTLSPDGTTLAMSEKASLQPAPALRLISLTDYKERLLPVPGWASLNSIDWASDGKSIWVSAATSQDVSALVNVTLNGRVRTMLTDDKMKIGWAIQSPDGKRLALWQASGTSNVWMLENF
jgi:Tol biopolymer transport system component